MSSAPLVGLSVARPPPSRGTGGGARMVLGIIVVGGLALAVLLWRRLAPALEVPVVPVAAAPAGVGVASGALVVRAAGWFHADPQAQVVAARRPGALTEIRVRPGASVTAGTVVAVIDGRDADLGLRRAEAAVAAMAAAVARAEAEVGAAEARLELARDRRDRLERADAALPAGDLAQARREVAVREAEVAVARAAHAQARSAQAASEVERDAARLEQERCTVVAPMDGVVLRLNAQPGQNLSLDEDGHARIAELYDPARLVVRADVALADAGRVAPGQAAELECDLLPGEVLAGRVEAVLGQADAARNTLAVLVRPARVPPGLRPDMLARVRIQVPAADAPTTVPADLLAVPAAALRERGAGRALAWVVDEHGRLRRRPVELAGPDRDGWVPVSAGLALGDPVVMGEVPGLEEGRRAAPIHRRTEGR